MIPKLDVLFLNLHRRCLNYEPTHGGFLGIYYLSAFLRKEGYAAKGFSGTFLEGTRFVDVFCSSDKVSMLGLYCDYDNVNENIFLSRRIKEKYNLPVIVGGPQATALDEKFFRESKCDAIVLDVGEITVLELARLFLDGRGELEKIRGIVYPMDSGLVKTPARSPIKNLDDLPFITDDCYLEPYKFYRGLNVMTGRGCPFHCAFCHEGIGKGVRFRSAENVLAEIDEYLKTWTEDELYFSFTDDTLTLNTKRIKKICAGLIERRKTHKIKFFCEGHVHTLYKNPELIRLLADSGCYRLQLGIESGNNDVLKAYGKNTTAEEILEVVRLCCEAGIQQVFGNIILGSAFFSEEIYETDKKFVRQLLEIGKGVVELGVVTFWPLPNTPMTLCPDKFGIKIFDKEFLTSAGDFPQTETTNFDRVAIAEKQADLENYILEVMLELIQSRQISTEKILEWFGQSAQYHGRWFMILSGRENVYAYYEMLYLGEGVESGDAENLAEAHPIRVVPLYKNLKRLDNNSVSILNEKFSNRELDIATLTTGKLSVAQIAEKISLSVFEVINVLHRFEKIFLIVYSPH